MNRAAAADPSNLEVLLALGVSHTNELEAGEAAGFLAQWVLRHPQYGAAAATVPHPPDSSQQLTYVTRLFEAAAEAHPQVGRGWGEGGAASSRAALVVGFRDTARPAEGLRRQLSRRWLDFAHYAAG